MVCRGDGSDVRGEEAGFLADVSLCHHVDTMLCRGDGDDVRWVVAGLVGDVSDDVDAEGESICACRRNHVSPSALAKWSSTDIPVTEILAVVEPTEVDDDPNDVDDDIEDDDVTEEGEAKNSG